MQKQRVDAVGACDWTDWATARSADGGPSLTTSAANSPVLGPAPDLYVRYALAAARYMASRS